MAFYNTCTFKIEIEDCAWTKKVNTTYWQADNYLLEWLEEKLNQYYIDMNITDPDEQEDIRRRSGASYEYDDENPVTMYAVYMSDAYKDPVVGVYYSLADAEEAIFTECEAWVEKEIMTADPMDMFGHEFNIPEDYWYLMKDSSYMYNIQTIPVYGVEIPKE